MQTISDQPEAHKHMRAMLEAMQQLTALYAEGEQVEQDDVPNREVEQELIDRIVEDAGELGMDEDGIEKVFRLVMSYCKKAAE